MNNAKTVLVLCNDASPDGGTSILPFLSLQNRMTEIGVRLFLAFPNSFRHCEWFSKLCLDGRTVEIFRNDDREALIASIGSLVEKVTPDYLFSFGLPASDVEKAVRGFKNTKSFIDYREEDYEREENQLCILKTIRRFLRSFYAKQISFLYGEDRLGEVLPKGSKKIPLLPMLFDQNTQGKTEGQPVTVGMLIDENRVPAVSAVIRAIHILNEKTDRTYDLELLMRKGFSKSASVIPSVSKNSEEKEDSTLIRFSDADDASVLATVDIWVDLGKPSIALKEALSFLTSGKPAVIATVSGIEELLRYSSVFAFDFDGEETLSAAIHQVVSCRKPINTEVSSYIRSSYSTDRWVSELEKAIETTES